MALEHRVAVAAVTLAVGIIATPVQATTFANSAVDFRAAAQGASLVEATASRRCWWRNGKRHCTGVGATRVYGSRNQRSDYYEHIPEKLPYGSSSWWDQMVRENRGGNPGGGRD